MGIGLLNWRQTFNSQGIFLKDETAIVRGMILTDASGAFPDTDNSVDLLEILIKPGESIR